MRLSLWLWAFFVVFAVVGCSSGSAGDPVHSMSSSAGSVEPPPSTSSHPTASRLLLTRDELLTGAMLPGPVDESAFAPVDKVKAEGFRFEGTIELLDETAGHIEVVQGDPNVEPELAQLPAFEFDFVQVEERLVPTRRGLIVTDHPTWNYYLEPGTVWFEAEDDGWARAAIPFALVPKGGNSTYNGTLAFLFNESRISNVWYQITQETSFQFRANFWGMSEASYEAKDLDESGEIADRYRQELSSRMPTKSVEALVDDFPGVDPSGFGTGLTPLDRTVFGVVVDGVNYMSGCTTRFGTYVHCEDLRSPSWSTAKSAFAGVALMRLAEEYGSEVVELRVADYVSEAAASPGDWSNVTFDNTIDMATGNYESLARMRDEEQFATHPFWGTTQYADKIEAAFGWPKGSEPGVNWVYHTSDTFIVTTAMGNYLDSRRPGADIFDYVVEEVFVPLGLGPGVASSLRTSDNNWQGRPYGGYGLWWIPDDIAKLSEMLLRGGTTPAGEQLLSSELVAASLQQDPSDRGVRIDDRNFYNNGFWATQYGPSQGYECEFWVVQMQGISGVVVVLMPNDTTYYYVSDGREFTWDRAVRESNEIRPHCGEGS